MMTKLQPVVGVEGEGCGRISVRYISYSISFFFNKNEAFAQTKGKS